MDLNEINYELGLFLASAPDMGPEASTCQIQSSSAADLSPKREVQGARRVRNACLQCRERKIRCSRTYPCKGCVSRGDGPACDWQGGFPTGNIPIYQRNVADQRRQIEKLKDRLTSAKACLGSALRNKQGLKLEVGVKRCERMAIYEMLISKRRVLSRLAHTKRSRRQSFRYPQETSACHGVQMDLAINFLDQQQAHQQFQVTGYRPLSLLREEDELAVGGSRPYAASGGQFTKASGFHHYCTRILQSYDRSNFLPYAGEASTPEAVPRHESMSAPRQSLAPSHNALIGSLVETKTRELFKIMAAHGGTYLKSNLDHHTPSRHSHDVFSLPYISSLRTDQISPTEVRSMCQHYLPQSQYLGSHGIDPATDPNKLNSRDFPWFIPI
ncbi:hypothetical protein PSHT_15002 [Puccinia striiformis]|uniref:Zn(2)-C6 fungal-type domain-containing protein n=1 Tax=Puccinia striiformis TaxID=27350 RepID=A0A2S4UHD9_9BASI|nr:hypothetical protein PSHT_15002 [Puccinia striiformis]